VAKVQLRANAEFDVLTKDELDQSLRHSLKDWDAMQVSRLAGIKPVRLPLVTGKAAASALTMGGDAGGQLVTPESGYVWSIRHLVIEGMTASPTTPDVMNIVRNGRSVWQLNGNQFAQTWGRGEVLLYAGETLQYVSVGTFNSTATIIAHGLAEEAPAQLVGKFYA
jgi:hypothetical protein